MSTTISPVPSHSSQRPPATLNEKQPGLSLRRRAFARRRETRRECRRRPSRRWRGSSAAMRPGGVGSTTATSRIRSAPSIASHCPRSGVRCRLPTSTERTRLVLPAPETPVTTTSCPSGISTSTPCRLCARAPRMSSRPLACGRRARVTWNAPASARPVERLRVRRDLGDAALRHDLTAAAPGAGPQVDQVIRGGDDLERVLDHDHGVAGIANSAQHFEQPPDVARVQAHRRLVEHVERGGERAAERRRELDALRLAARERAHLAVEREVAETDAPRRTHPRAQAVEYALAARLLRRSQRERREPGVELADRRDARRRRCSGRRSPPRAPRCAAACRRTPRTDRSAGSARSPRAPAPCSDGPRATRSSRCTPYQRRRRLGSPSRDPLR